MRELLYVQFVNSCLQSPPCGVFLVRTQRKTFRMRWGTLRVKLLLRISIINRPSLKINILALISIPQNLLDNLDSQLLRSVWRLHAGKHRSSGEAASVFVCDTKSGASNTQLDVARCLTLSLNHFQCLIAHSVFTSSLNCTHSVYKFS